MNACIHEESMCMHRLSEVPCAKWYTGVQGVYMYVLCICVYVHVPCVPVYRFASLFTCVTNDMINTVAIQISTSKLSFMYAYVKHFIKPSSYDML